MLCFFGASLLWGAIIFYHFKDLIPTLLANGKRDKRKPGSDRLFTE